MSSRARFSRWSLRALLASLCAGLSIVAAQERSVNDGVYSEAQAERGKGTFERTCTSCHDTNRFTGEAFLESWSGQPLGALYEVMRTTMPEDNPGSLKPQQYADVLSFILKLNGFTAGQEELRAAGEAMKAISMEKPRK
jgi:mono/diheme cytochrome c family protein